MSQWYCWLHLSSDAVIWLCDVAMSWFHHFELWCVPWWCISTTLWQPHSSVILCIELLCFKEWLHYIKCKCDKWSCIFITLSYTSSLHVAVEWSYVENSQLWDVISLCPIVASCRCTDISCAWVVVSSYVIMTWCYSVVISPFEGHHYISYQCHDKSGLPDTCLKMTYVS